MGALVRSMMRLTMSKRCVGMCVGWVGGGAFVRGEMHYLPPICGVENDSNVRYPRQTGVLDHSQLAPHELPHSTVQAFPR